MKIDGKHYRTIWPHADGASVEVIDQTRLPHEFATLRLANLSDAVAAIRSMVVRGAPLIGVTAAYGLALAMRFDASDDGLTQAYRALLEARPTAVNLRWALDEMRARIAPLPPSARPEAAWTRAAEIADEDVAISQRIGVAGLPLIETAYAKTGRPVNILTHCNAGWLATVDWGTATAPIYMAHDAGIPVHIWVDETRPRNQGGSLTAYELGHHGVPHTIVVDNAGGHLMQHGMVDLCIVGTDRTPRFRPPRDRPSHGAGFAGVKLRVRRHAGRICDGADHRSRRLRGIGRGTAQSVRNELTVFGNANQVEGNRERIMDFIELNGVALRYELSGRGDHTLVLV